MAHRVLVACKLVRRFCAFGRSITWSFETLPRSQEHYRYHVTKHFYLLSLWRTKASDRGDLNKYFEFLKRLSALTSSPRCCSRIIAKAKAGHNYGVHKCGSATVYRTNARSRQSDLAIMLAWAIIATISGWTYVADLVREQCRPKSG